MIHLVYYPQEFYGHETFQDTGFGCLLTLFFFLLVSFFIFFYASIFESSFVDLDVHLIAFGLYRGDLWIQQWTNDSYEFAHGILKIVKHFKDLGCVGHEVNLVLIRVCFHWLWVHFSEHLWVV